jgi:hypothetical protein
MIRNTGGSGPGCLWRGFGAYAIFVIGCLILAEALAHGFASHRVRRTQEAWAGEGAPLDAFAARFPYEPSSPAALQLDERTRSLGIHMVLRENARPSDPTNAQQKLLAELGSAVGKLSRSADGVPPPLPPAAEALLERERSTLGAIVGHILEAGPLRWELDISKGLAGPTPSLLGHRQLQGLLLARSWVAARDGRPAEAERALEASWRLNASFVERPELISQLIAVAVASMQHEVLRVTPQPAPIWRSRMSERPFSSGFSTSLQFEAAGWMRFADGSWGVSDLNHYGETTTPPRGPLGRIGRFLTAPYVQLSVADTSDALLRARRELARQRRCDLDMTAYSKRFEESLPRWNVIGRVASPSVVRAWVSLREGDLDRELTERALIARAERAASGAWPRGPFASTVCEGASWEYRATAGGGLSLRGSANPFALQNPKWTWDLRLRP